MNHHYYFKRTKLILNCYNPYSSLKKRRQKMLARNLFQNVDNKFDLNELRVGNPLINECAELSLRIYDILPAHLATWTLFDLYYDAGTDYRGACYARNLLTKNAQILLVHRGSVFTFPNGIFDVIGDIEIALNLVPIQFTSFLNFCLQLNKKMLDLYKFFDEKDSHAEMMQYIQYVSTGHSLGAVLSDCSSATGLITSITFENPGSKAAICQILTNYYHAPVALQEQVLNTMKMTCVAYQAGVNLINTCNEQVGTTFRINTDYNYDLTILQMPRPLTANYRLNLYYLIANTKDQHQMELILKKILSNDCQVDLVQNPIGFNAGYVEYLNPNNIRYWPGYFKKIWINDPLLHVLYKHDEKLFYADCFKQLARTQKEARGDKKLLSNHLVLFKPKPTTDEIINDFVMVNHEKEEDKKPAYCPMM